MATATPNLELALQGVTKRFADVLAVRGIDLAVQRGEFVSLLGPSGCGKTTTLRLIAGFEQPDEGAIKIAGEDVHGLPAYRRDVNTVFQSYALFPHLSVLENVAYGLRHRGMDRSTREARARRMLGIVRLEGVEKRRPTQLSGGQQQRVALARALVMNPKVLLLDEPLGALDLAVRKQLQIELKTIQAELDITFVYVTHDQEEALALSDRVAVMNRGRIEQIGTPGEIYDRPATEFVAGFIGETNFLQIRGETFAVRPERMRLLAAPPDHGRSVTATVVTTMVIGPALQFVVVTDDGQELIVRQQRTDGDGETHIPAEGERVVVGWTDDAALELEGTNEEDSHA